MEAVGLTASLAQLINITAKTIKYLNSVREASKDRANLFQEASSLLPLLVSLQAQVNDAKQSEPWFHEVKLLGVENGPLDQLREALVQLTAKLKPKHGVDKAARAFIWTFDKAYCESVLHKIERVKSRTALALQRDTFKLAQAIKADTAGIEPVGRRVEAVAEDLQTIRLGEDLQKRQKILEWFSPLNFFKTQQDIFARKQEGTGQWLIDSPAFQNWLSGLDRTLCCPGIPGAGKTVLASVVVNALRSNQRQTSDPVGVAALYCNFKEREIQSPHNLLAAACAQLIQGSMQSLPKGLMSLHKRHCEKNTSEPKTRPSWEEINEIFDSVAEGYQHIYIVVDAIDECSEQVRNVVIPGLKALPDNVSILITTRPINEITRSFPLGPKLEIRANDLDLTKYIRSRIASNPRLAHHVQGQSTLEQDICTQIKAKADGMFLAAMLHMDSLSTKTSVKSLKKALDNLSSTLHELYDDALHRINSQSHDDQKLAEKALRWVAYAYRPLSTEMLEEAVAINPEERDFDVEALPPIGLILDVCSGLLIVDEEVDVVRLVHYTAQDYFNSKSNYPEAHASIAGECLAYFNYHNFQPGSDYPSSSLLADDLQFDPQLLRYASTFWALHAKARLPKLELKIRTWIREFLESDPYVALITIQQYDAPYSCGMARCIGYGIAAFFRLCDTLHDLLPDAANINGVVIEKSDYDCGLTALQLAAIGDQAFAVEVLLQHGADIEGIESPAGRPLLLAIEAKAVAAAYELVDGGADVRPTDHDSGDPIHLVTWWSPVPFIECLVTAGAKISKSDLFCRASPLMRSIVDHEDIETARWLFEHATPSALDSEKRSESFCAFYDAVEAGCIGIVNMFLEYDDNLMKGVIKTTLHTAIACGHTEVALTLLRHGIDVNYQDASGLTALHLASLHGQPRVGEEIIKNSAAVDMQSRHTVAMLCPEVDSLDRSLPYARWNVQCGNATRAALIQQELFDDPAMASDLYGILFKNYPISRHHASSWPDFKDLTAENEHAGGSRDSTFEWRAFPHGMTALDIAIIRNEEGMISLLKPLTKSIEETNTLSFEQYLCKVHKLSTFDRVLRKLAKAKARESYRHVQETQHIFANKWWP